MIRCAVLFAAMAVSPMVAQEEPAGAKAMFHNPAETSLVAVYHEVDLRGPDGRFTPVAPNYKFRSHDRIRLRLKANVAGVLTILARDDDRKPFKLFPKAPAESLPVSRGHEETVYLTFDAKPDDVELIVVLAKVPGAPADWIEKIKSASKHAAELAGLETQFGGGKGIALEKDQSGGYAAARLDSPAPPGILATRLKLAHAK
jgi:hypothetical protein